jgi:hypothetical protein
VLARLEKTLGQAGRRYQSELIIQKERWRTLHTYIKPATDAHTLNLPVPLIQMATEDLKRIPGIGETALVVLLTPELMYYHNTPQSQFRRDRVFVEVPYSQGPSFFANLTIYHELGHYVLEKLKEADPKSPAFSAMAEAMERAYADSLGPRLTSARVTTWAKGVLDAWTNEIFCDLFALRHLGPAFSFALADVLSLIGLMGEETEGSFDKDHPAPALRFREQFARLGEDGWWALVQDLPSEHVSLIRRLADKSESDYLFRFSGETIPGFVEAFLTILPLIHKLAIDVTPHCSAMSEDFGLRRADIETCLLHGVVPSQLLAEKETSSPTPVSMINAAYCFCLARLPELMDKLENQNVRNPRDRKNCMERIEAWTMKGIEDAQLFENAKGS